MAGLALGKPIGILSFCYLSIKAKLAKIPEGVNWTQITGASVLGGIGFTMSIFITFLAFEDTTIIDQSKIAIVISSLAAGIVGYFIIRVASRVGLTQC